MIIAFDITPLKDQNRNRGVGKYTQYLLAGIKKIISDKNIQDRFLIKEFDRSKPLPCCDLVHYPYFDPFYLTLPLIKKVPVVVTVHDLIPFVFPKYYPSGLKGKIKWEVQKISLQKVSAVITDSYQSKQDINHYAGIDPSLIEVIYLAPLFSNISISEMDRCDFNKKFQLPPAFFLYIGDLNYHKNLSNLYQALAILNSKYQANYLVVVGKAFLDNNLKEKRELDKLSEKLNLNDKIIKLGEITDKEIKMLYHRSLGYIQPSLYEGFGLPVIEALSESCLVAVGRAGSLSEIISKKTLIFNPLDPQDIAKTLSKLFSLTEAEKEEIKINGFQKSLEFSWNQTAEKTLSVYSKVYKDVDNHR